MDNIIGVLLTQVLHGGPEVIAVLGLVIVMLVFERRRLIKALDQKDERMTKIIDEYYRGSITLSEALTSLKMLLFDIKSKL
jgi:hypothetical protein